MDILIKENSIIAVAEKISYGVFDEAFEKWKLEDSEGRLMYYIIDDDFTLAENMALPSDYVEGKYFYENGEFILNTEWQPYYSIEERVTMLEDENKRLSLENEESVEHEAELLYELSLLRLGIEY